MSFMLLVSNGEVNSSNSTGATLTSYAALTGSVILWGLNYVPVKQFETGDGFFFQFIFAIAVWSSGFVVYLIKGITQFYWLAMLGGMFWSLSNVFTVPVIKLIGYGLGMLMWNSACLILGWAVPRYGLFGIKKEVPNLVALNYMGLFLCFSALICFFLVTPEESGLKIRKKKIHVRQQQQQPLLDESETETKYGSINTDESNKEKNTNIYDRLNPVVKKIVGILFALLCGFAAACSYIPILYIENTYPNASQDQNDYALSYNTGIFFGALLFFIIYCLVNKNRPKVYPNAILPTFLAGTLWLAANTLYFSATNGLSQAITFPIVNSAPCCIAFLVGLFYGEIKGLQNYIPLLIGILFSLVGSSLIGVSK